MNNKQISYRFKKALKRKQKTVIKLFMLMLVLLSAPAFATSIAEDTAPVEGIGMVVLANMAVIGSIDDSNDRDAAGNQIAHEVWLISTSQIDKNARWPKPNANREVGTIPLLPGEVMHFLEAHTPPTDDGKGEKGDFTTAGTNSVVIAMSGNRDKLLDFIEQYAGTKFILIYRDAEVDTYRILGTIGKPMVLKTFERANNNEKRGVTFTFENTSLSQPCKYVGELYKAKPIIVAADAVAIAVEANNDVYVLSDGTAAAVPVTSVTGLTDDDKGRILILRGSGTANSATIEDGAVFILEDGATWIATTGSSISLRVIDPSRLVEVSGTRIQKQ